MAANGDLPDSSCVSTFALLQTQRGCINSLCFDKLGTRLYAADSAGVLQVCGGAGAAVCCTQRRRVGALLRPQGLGGGLGAAGVHVPRLRYGTAGDLLGGTLEARVCLVWYGFLTQTRRA